MGPVLGLICGHNGSERNWTLGSALHANIDHDDTSLRVPSTRVIN
jgi:hypothetical protein